MDTMITFKVDVFGFGKTLYGNKYLNIIMLIQLIQGMVFPYL